jgi:hypothetical protein
MNKTMIVAAVSILIVLALALGLWSAWPTDTKLKQQISASSGFWEDHFYSEMVVSGSCAISVNDLFDWVKNMGGAIPNHLTCQVIPDDPSFDLTKIVTLYGVYAARLSVDIGPEVSPIPPEQIILAYDGTKVTVTLPPLTLTPKLDPDPQYSRFFHVDRELNPLIELALDQFAAQASGKIMAVFDPEFESFPVTDILNTVLEKSGANENDAIGTLSGFLGNEDEMAKFLSQNADGGLLESLKEEAQEQAKMFICQGIYSGQLKAKLKERLELYLDALYWDIFTIEVTEPAFSNCE